MTGQAIYNAIVWQLTVGTNVATRAQANAARMRFFNMHKNAWDTELLDAMHIPAHLLPAVKPSSTLSGLVQPALPGAAMAIDGITGDQQSALFGQACFKPGRVKNTYGTG